MSDEIKADETVVPATTQEPVITGEQDPLKPELERVQRKTRTKEEKLIYTRNRINQQLNELGVSDEEPDDEDDKPLTVGEFKKMQAQTATKTALQLADEVSNETERELLKHHLQHTIRSTGNPKEDLRLAQSLVNSVKNSQIIEEGFRKGTPQTSSGSGAPAKISQPEEEFTQEEMSFMRPPFNLTKAQVIAARKK